MAAPRPPLAPWLDVYRVPPTELVVETGEDAIDAVAYAARFGPFFVVTSDNPGSTARGDAENAADRADCAARLVARGLRAVSTRALDPTGVHPEESGFVVADRDLALGLARRYGQLAIYEVTAEGVAVLDARNGARHS